MNLHIIMQERIINMLTQILIKIKKKGSYMISLDENTLYAFMNYNMERLSSTIIFLSIIMSTFLI